MHEIVELPGTGESHVIPIFQRIIHSFYEHQQSFQNPEVLAQRLDTANFRRHILEYIRTFYQSAYPAGCWVDKTPGDDALFGAPLIRQAFPSAKLICTKRTGVEVVESFRAKFSASFEAACRAWAGSMDALLAVRTACPDLLELDQYDMTNAPDAIAREITDHLGIPEKKEALRAFFLENRTDQLSSHDWHRRLRMADTGWSEEERKLFVGTCGELMQKFDYPL
jgi:hypothetical protein